MKRYFNLILVITGMSFLLVGCGLNPFGAGAPTYSIFAKIAKALQRPSAINDENQSKKTAMKIVSNGGAMAKRLAKKTATSPRQHWLDTAGIYRDESSGHWIYFEVVKNKPSEDDPEKLLSGRAEVEFDYNGQLKWPDVEPEKIISVYRWHYTGLEYKTWRSELCTVNVTVTFSNPLLTVLTPGKTRVWARNISSTNMAGRGDTAYFELDSLDELNHIQFGRGHFYDAHSGRDNSGEPKSFDFKLQVFHLNSQDPSKPYLRYQDNEGLITFYLPWGKNNADSLYFMIHFYPKYYRDGLIRKDGPEGPVVVKFEYNEKTGIGQATYYDPQSGKETETEQWN